MLSCDSGVILADTLGNFAAEKLPADIRISCSTDDECPREFRCQSESGLCVTDAADTAGPVLQAAAPLSETLVELSFDTERE